MNFFNDKKDTNDKKTEETSELLRHEIAALKKQIESMETEVKEAAQLKDKLDKNEKELIAQQEELSNNINIFNTNKQEFEAQKMATLAKLKEDQSSIEALQAECEKRAQAIARRENDVRNKQVELDKQELEIKAGLPTYFDEEFSAVKQKIESQQQVLSSEKIQLENERKVLIELKHQIDLAKAEQNNGFILLKEAQAQQLAEEKQRKLAEASAAQEALLTKQAAEAENRLTTLHEEFKNQELNLIKSQEIKRLSLQAELGELEKNTKQEIEKLTIKLAEEKENLAQERGTLEALKEDLDFQQSLNQRRASSLEESEVEFEERIKQKTVERERSFKAEEKRLKDECERLRASVDSVNRDLSLYQELKQKLDGQAPEQVLAQFQMYKEEIAQLKQDLLDRPQAEIKQLYEQARIDKGQLEAQVQDKRQKISTLEQQIRDYSATSFEITELEERNKSLKVMHDASERRCNELQAELERLSPSTNAKQNREERLKQIQMPLIALSYEQKQQLMGFHPDQLRSEIDWLKDIYNQCNDYGITFNPRILFAFHTALKTAEWSPITVLAGVSGTGKSELPRLYSRFGGVNFLNLPVQPNWDSQESMLGFFNSIDNCFDAQPVLRLLAQSQLDCSEDYPGLAQGVNLVLLDEMNLAHVELYFADFLSKLEQRRGSSKKELPSLDIKLGSGIEPYELPLGRNVLWVGTMNQDETTKALSDKVLDRGVAIHFPRPLSLHSRKFKMLPPPAPLLHIKQWGQWVDMRNNPLTEEMLAPYKNIIEQLNANMATVGRALGHRVWQSVEYYMASYPMVKAFADQTDSPEFKKWLHLAFEDQLVQKVMPKLRGIETRGLGKKKCLDPIRQLLIDEGFNIIDDFDKACLFGYGQFIWSSAEYLNDTSMFQDFSSQQKIDEAEKPEEVEIAVAEPA